MSDILAFESLNTSSKVLNFKSLNKGTEFLLKNDQWLVMGYMVIAQRNVANYINNFQRASKELFLATLALKKLANNNIPHFARVFMNKNSDCSKVSLEALKQELNTISEFKSYKEFKDAGYSIELMEQGCDYVPKEHEHFWFYWINIPSDVPHDYRRSLSPHNIKRLAEKGLIGSFKRCAYRHEPSNNTDAGDILAQSLLEYGEAYVYNKGPQKKSRFRNSNKQDASNKFVA